MKRNFLVVFTFALLLSSVTAMAADDGATIAPILPAPTVDQAPKCELATELKGEASLGQECDSTLNFLVQGGPPWGTTCQEPQFENCMSACDADRAACQEHCVCTGGICPCQGDCEKSWNRCADNCALNYCDI